MRIETVTRKGREFAVISVEKLQKSIDDGNRWKHGRSLALRWT